MVIVQVHIEGSHLQQPGNQQQPGAQQLASACIVGGSGGAHLLALPLERHAIATCIWPLLLWIDIASTLLAIANYWKYTTNKSRTWAWAMLPSLAACKAVAPLAKVLCYRDVHQEVARLATCEVNRTEADATRKRVPWPFFLPCRRCQEVEATVLTKGQGSFSKMQSKEGAIATTSWGTQGDGGAHLRPDADDDEYDGVHNYELIVHHKDQNDDKHDGVHASSIRHDDD